MGLRAGAAAFVIVFVATIAGCTTATSDEAASGYELYHHNWWNYYERGFRYLSEGQVQLARADFETALGVRPGAKFGYPFDMWRARTYGLHFTEEYFPHRELGICIYLLADDDAKAIEYLSTSLQQEPSGRAKHYLNMARQRMLQSQNITPPSVQLDQATRKTWTKERARPFSGVARGEGLVREILVNGERQFIELASSEKPFEQEIVLSEGRNAVNLVITDLAGNTTKKSYTWYADWHSPNLVVRSITKDAGDWVIKGACRDNFGFSSVSLMDRDGTSSLLPAGKKLKSLPVEVRISADEEVLFRAVDLAGNEFSTTLRAEMFTDDEAWLRGPRYTQLGEPGVADVGGAEAPVSETKPDHDKPVLRTKVASTTRVYSDEYYIDGTASDRGGLASLLLHGDELLKRDDRGAVSFSFSQRVPLEVGTNRFSIVASDQAGNTVTKHLEVIRQVPSYLDKKYRLSLVLVPLLSSDASLPADRVSQNLESELLIDPVRFFLLERGAGWEAILQEQALNLSSLSDPKAAMKAGKLLTTEMLLSGSILREASGITVLAGIVDAETGEIIAKDDIYTEDLDAELDYKIRGLAMKLEQHFPLIEGRITGASGGKAAFDVGSDQGVRKGMKFMVLRVPSENAPIEQGRLQKVKNQLVQLDVSHVKPMRGKADVFPSEAKDVVEAGDVIYAR